MKILSKLLVFLILLLNTVQAQQNDIPPNELDVIQKVVKILNYSHTSNKVWPGYDLTQSPIVITFSSGHVFVFNHTSSDPAFESLVVDHMNLLYSSSDKWGASPVEFNPKFSFEGQSAYLFNLNQALENPLKPLHILIHERFHQFEFDRFQPPELIGNYQDHLNAENLALSKLEEQVLLDFMQAQGNPVLQRELIRDLIAVNGMRRLLLNNPSIAWEDHQQVMEGLADYVGYKMIDALHLTSATDGDKALTFALKREIENKDYSDHAIKWRHYNIGASLGYVLDFLQIPNWKEAVQKGNSNLQTLLNDSVLMTSQEMETRFERIKTLYHWDEIFTKTSGFVDKFEDEIESLKVSYNDLEGVTLSIEDPGTGLSGSGSNDRMIYLHDGTLLSLNDNLTAISEDNLWKLELHRIPFIFKYGNGQMECKIDPKAAISLDDETVPLETFISKGQKKTFKHIKIKGKNINLISDNIEGQVRVTSNGTLLIRYE